MLRLEMGFFDSLLWVPDVTRRKVSGLEDMTWDRRASYD